MGKQDDSFLKYLLNNKISFFKVYFKLYRSKFK